MSWWSWFTDDEDSSSGSDDSWWGYVLGAASEYADSEGKKKDKKQDFKNQLKLLQEKYALEDKYKMLDQERLKEAYSGYSQYSKPTDATSQNPTNPLQVFEDKNNQRGLLTNGRRS